MTDPTEDARASIAAAVHEAVCRASNSEGQQLCEMYAEVGARVAFSETGEDQEVLYGALFLHPIPGSTTDVFFFEPEWVADGPYCYHAVFRAVGSCGLVDLSTRHFEEYLSATPERYTWQHDEPMPAYVWVDDINDLPDGYDFRVQTEFARRARRHIMLRKGQQIENAVRLATRLLRESRMRTD